MTKKFAAGVAMIVVGTGLIVWSFTREQVPEPLRDPAIPDDDGQMCAQVITSAKNPETGEVVEFPTPCDVPEGWEVQQPNVAE